MSRSPGTGFSSLAIAGLVYFAGVCSAAASGRLDVLDENDFAHYVERLNGMEPENWTNAVPNAKSWEWMRTQVPLLECPDKEVEEIYYYRWWSFRKHLVETTNGTVLTEFLVPMRHAGANNTISCAAGHHLMEGRWLREQLYLDEYTRFWLRGDHGKAQPHFHRYSSWFAAAVYERYLANADRQSVTSLLDDLAADFQQWEQERRLTNGLFWQYDVRDGMEESISGSRTEKNIRPTINSYMFGNARAIEAIARLAGRTDLELSFKAKAVELKSLVQQQLWNPQAKFFEVRLSAEEFAGVREQLGFIPWYFGLPDQGYEEAWAQLRDAAGFQGAYGLTTAEKRHPGFRSHGCCGCEWDGAVWPFATSQTLTALGKLLRDYAQTIVTRKDYFELFLEYVRCQRMDGKPYIGEYLDETTGQWLKGKQDRSRYYNHSTFADLLITGVIGLRPRPDETVEVDPLLPEGRWDWFCLDGLPYHGKTLTILWDHDGKRYRKGQGLAVFSGAREMARRPTLGKLTGKLQ
jgi:hypothetical protein